MESSQKAIVVTMLALLAIASVGFVSTIGPVLAGEVNPAHDADNGNGNEGSLGQCKQEANNDNACTAKK